MDGDAEPVFLPSAGRAPCPPTPALPSVLGAQPQTFARGREVAALLLWTFAMFLSLALASYAGDPGRRPAPAPTIRPRSRARTGSARSAPSSRRAFVTLVGVAAWVVPLEALLLGIPFVRGRKTQRDARAPRRRHPHGRHRRGARAGRLARARWRSGVTPPAA